MGGQGAAPHQRLPGAQEVHGLPHRGARAEGLPAQEHEVRELREEGPPVLRQDEGLEMCPRRRPEFRGTITYSIGECILWGEDWGTTIREESCAAWQRRSAGVGSSFLPAAHEASRHVLVCERRYSF